MKHAGSLARAGFTGTPLEAGVALFEAILAGSSGMVFAVDEWNGAAPHIRTPDHKLRLTLPDMLEELDRLLRSGGVVKDEAYPFVLSAGERRSFTANTIIRDPAWRKKDPGGALRIHPLDAAALGIADGGPVRLTTRRHSLVVNTELSETMQRGHVSLPNGHGVSYAGDPDATGTAPNELTSTADRDPFVGTPWHKHVPARVERV
jgi:anaerobic selenocysteine-containing dehydrogenase